MKEECSLCKDTLENTQLICWTCFCKMKDEVRQSKLKEVLDKLEWIKKEIRIQPTDRGIEHLKSQIIAYIIPKVEEELSGGEE